MTQPTKRGAPSLSGKGGPKSPRLCIVIPPELDERIRADAKAAGVSLSVWVRRLLEVGS